MFNLENKPTFSLWSPSEQMSVIESIRTDRLTAKATTQKTKTKRQKKTAAEKAIDSLSAAEIEILLAKIEEKTNG